MLPHDFLFVEAGLVEFFLALLTKREISFRVASTDASLFGAVFLFSDIYLISTMNQELIAFNLSKRRTDLPPVRTGDVVRVTRKIKEGAKERLQVFEGMIIAEKGGQSSSPTLTIRKVSFGIGVELILPMDSPQVEKIEFVKRTKAGRSKIYYVRHKSAKVLSRKLKEIPGKGMTVPASVKAKEVKATENSTQETTEEPSEKTM